MKSSKRNITLGGQNAGFGGAEGNNLGSSAYKAGKDKHISVSAPDDYLFSSPEEAPGRIIRSGGSTIIQYDSAKTVFWK